MGIELSKKERKQLISKISQASGVAQYALEAKMTDEQIVEATKNLNVFLLIKSANNFNRYCQSEKTATANAKLKEFVDIKNSELFKAGQWLFHSLSKTGLERQQSLLENNLVHKDDYNEAVSELGDVIKVQQHGAYQGKEQAKEIIHVLENKIDNLRKQLIFIEGYISKSQGSNAWINIQKKLHEQLKYEEANYKYPQGKLKNDKAN